MEQASRILCASTTTPHPNSSQTCMSLTPATIGSWNTALRFQPARAASAQVRFSVRMEASPTIIALRARMAYAAQKVSRPMGLVMCTSPTPPTTGFLNTIKCIRPARSSRPLLVQLRSLRELRKQHRAQFGNPGQLPGCTHSRSAASGSPATSPRSIIADRVWLRSALAVFQLLFVPKRIGPDNGVLTITDDASGGSQSIKLTGIGDSALANSTSHLAFGNQLVGTKSVPQAVTLTNTRDSRSNNLQISLTGDFVQTNTCGKLSAC